MLDPRNPLNKSIPTFQRPTSSQPNNLNPNPQSRQPTYSRLKPNNNLSQNLSSNNLLNPNRSRGLGNKSRLSHGSSISEDSHNLAVIVSDGEIFPQDLLFLLSDEERNINSFKERIQKEKTKLDNDFKLFSKQIEHIVEDLKISLHAELDNVYRFFIEKYANLKTEVQDVRRIRKQIEAQNYAQDFSTSYGPSNSNKELIKQLQRDAENYKLYRIQNYITQMQKKKLNPLLDISKEIILLGTANNSFYNADNTLKQLTELKQNFRHFVKHMFGGIGNYITNPKTIIDNNMLADLDEMEDFREEEFQPTRIPPQYSQEMPAHGQPQTPYMNAQQTTTYPAYVAPPIVVNQPPAQYIPAQHPPIISDFQPQTHKPAMTVFPKLKCNISNSQQIISVDWAENLSVKPYSTITSDHSEALLCAIMVAGKFIVTGGKDKILNVYNISDGSKVTTLRAHEARICTLTLINDPEQGLLLASGSDHGCSSVILWNTQSWAIKHKIQSHTAAVTSILDLCDGQTLASGSYDKKINIYNYKKAEIMYSLMGTNSSVTNMVLNASKSKMISCGLDNSLTVWHIQRRRQIRGTVDSIVQERVIQNNSMMCAVNCSLLNSDIVIAGTKDGKIKIWNINTGEIQSNFTANNNAIIELVVVERESKPGIDLNHPLIFSCSSRDKALMLTRTETGISTFFEVGGKLNIEFGCGIGPKAIFDQDRVTGKVLMGLVSQVPQRKEVNIFQLNIS